MKLFAVGLVVGILVVVGAVGAWVVMVGRIGEAD